MRTIKTRNWKNFTFGHLENYRKSNLKETSDQLLKLTKTKNIWRFLLNIALSYLNLFCPYRYIRIRTDMPCWISTETKKLLRQKEEAMKLAYHSPTPVNVSIMKFVRNKSHWNIGNDKRKFILKSIRNCGKNNLKFWGEINKAHSMLSLSCPLACRYCFF